MTTPMLRSDGTVEPLAARPLDGTVVRTLGDSLALRVAAARLRALGCVVEDGGAAPPRDAPAGWLGVTLVPFGSGGEVLPECRISWSGPVAVPMAGERDVQAACGVMQVHGRATGAPRPLGVDYVSVCAGVLAAQAVTAGLLALLRGGTAVVAGTSLAQAALLALTQYVAVATAGPGEPPPGEATVQPGSGRPPIDTGERTPPFRSADGVSCEIETFDAEYWRRFWVALGVERTAIAAGWPPFQQRFATATCTLPTALQSAVAALDYRSVRAAAEAAGVSILPVRAADASGIPIPASPWRLRPLTCPGDDAPGTAGAVPALPPLGPQGLAPLAGLRVVEATNRVQGPLAGHLLGLLGAEVVRLEPPGGDPMRGVPPMAGDCSARFLALNRGKGAVEADLKSVSGRRTALRLTASAHVFLHNWPPGRAVRFELDHDDLAAVRPSLVYAHAGGWADTLPAPQPLGTDYLVQAHTGVAALLSGPDAPPTPTLMTITDVLGALISAEGIVAALLARARTGLGMRAETALVDAAFLIHDTATTGSGPAPGTCPSTGTGTTLCPVTDLAAMAADPTFSAALDTGGAATYSSAPWTFAPPVPHRSEPTPHRSLPLRADAAPFQGGHRP